MRVDESLVLVARRKNADEARLAAEEVMEDFKTPLKIVRIEAENHVDKYGARVHRVTLVPDWRGYDGS